MRRLLQTLALALLVLAPAAQATWSIVAVDRRTGEVIVAGATCVSGIDLDDYLPVIVVGKGVGAVQFFPDGNAVNRNAIRDVFLAGGTAAEAFQAVQDAGVTIQNHQYGICAMSGAPLTFSGNQCWFAYSGRAGEVGDLAYAVQGNSLSCNEVVLMAEAAFKQTQGDLGTRVMAAMEAAALLGGDGRCSCNDFTPNACGCSPPNSQTTATTGFLVWSRLGDVDGSCTPAQGCVNGSYFAKLSVQANSSLVGFLRASYDAWRAGQAGRPDHLNSRVLVPDQRLRANGTDSTTVTLELVDIEGVPLVTGGAQLSLVPVVPGVDPFDLGAVTDHGDGTYSLELTSNGQVGRGAYEVWVDDGAGAVRLFPDLFVEADALAPLHLSRWEVRASEGGVVRARLDLPAEAGRPYQVLASTAGTSPGVAVGGVLVPLNPSRLFGLTLQGGLPWLPGGAGTLDAAGGAEAQFLLDPAVAVHLVGTRIQVAALLADQGSGAAVVGPASFRVNP